MKLFFLCFFIFTSKAFLLTAQSRINIYDQRDHYKKVNLSEVADSIVYIPLETTDSCLLSDELQIFYGKDAIFVGDQKNERFYRFDKHGSFLNTIGQKGEGPADYTSALNFYVDEIEKYVYIISPQSKTIFIYNYLGEFIDRIILDFTPWMIQNSNKKILFYNNRFNRIDKNKNVKELYLTNDKGNIIDSLPTTIDDKSMDMLLLEMPFFYQYKAGIFYKNPLSDLVYKISIPLSIKPIYEIYTGPVRRSKNDFKNMEKLSQMISVRNIIESDKSIMIVFAYKGNFFNIWFDKKSKSALNVKNTYPGFIDNITNGPDILPYWQSSSSESVFISLLTIEYLEKYPIKIKGDFFRKETIDSNPVLAIVKLK